MSSEMEKAYRHALMRLAEHVGVSTDALLQSEELTIDGVPVGLSLDGDTEGDPVIQVFCAVGVIPGNDAAHVYRELLRANAFGVDTQGATFGMQHGADRVVLAQKLGADAETQTLAETMRHLAHLAHAWQRQLGLQA